MTSATTATFPDDRDRQAGTIECPQLYLTLECDRPRVRGARYALSNVDEVVIGRGSDRSTHRESYGGLRRLQLRLPGKYLSSLHARLRNVGGDWVLEDAGSKNGSLVNGERVDRKLLGPGDVVELGHKLFLLAPAEPTPSGAPHDFDAESARGAPGLATLIPRLAEDFDNLRRVGATAISVLVFGETGTGKELLARAVHQLSGRAGSLVAINCGALTQTLAESLLFGHAKGAFSGALRDEPGFVRSADGGTLLLDEIGDLPPPSQAMLLRVLQERLVTPIGSARGYNVDVRFVAATHRALDDMVANGSFRRDLHARLNGFALTLPSLRDRKADFGTIVAELLSSTDAADLTIAPDAAHALLAYDWPANVRELEQCLSRALALRGDGTLRLRDLPPAVPARPGSPPSPSNGAAPGWSESELELHARLVEALQRHNGNVTEVARALGKARMQVQRWIKKFGIDARHFRK